MRLLLAGILSRERWAFAIPTGHDDGTGFGLAIVAALVNAHGWDIAVTDSDSGGAWFEVTESDTHTLEPES